MTQNGTIKWHWHNRLGKRRVCAGRGLRTYLICYAVLSETRLDEGSRTNKLCANGPARKKQLHPMHEIHPLAWISWLGKLGTRVLGEEIITKASSLLFIPHVCTFQLRQLYCRWRVYCLILSSPTLQSFCPPQLFLSALNLVMGIGVGCVRVRYANSA